MNARFLEKTFHDVFFSAYNTVLKGGFEEPFYLAQDPQGISQIQYRYDYPSSALHEVSHWCVAGPQRRQQDDFGYWYAEDGRSLEQQKEFEKFEVQPQAYECLLHWSCGMRFDVSVDNLALPDYDASPFRNAVLQRALELIENGIPERVLAYATALYVNHYQAPAASLLSHLRECHENYCR
ncbi:Elongation factor P hydroxylase [Marinomonas aquimarina]|uniref:Elongation factor P hydroxylase n=1 Tax=Marinomonas aquimarina TaxID=295068 RepID=A0A1A8TF31_9GAMM|nr:elongation factor P hydroxylase [Marinomonas aquimarina]SBS31622.1 Elongation factor P hydroxylase [Marinomonas aquimarina]